MQVSHFTCTEAGTNMINKTAVLHSEWFSYIPLLTIARTWHIADYSRSLIINCLYYWFQLHVKQDTCSCDLFRSLPELVAFAELTSHFSTATITCNNVCSFWILHCMPHFTSTVVVTSHKTMLVLCLRCKLIAMLRLLAWIHTCKISSWMSRTQM